MQVEMHFCSIHNNTNNIGCEWKSLTLDQNSIGQRNSSNLDSVLKNAWNIFDPFYWFLEFKGRNNCGYMLQKSNTCIDFCPPPAFIHRKILTSSRNTMLFTK